jgi:hypothetical protein
MRCEECGVQATGKAERWRALVTRDDAPSLVFYCAECAEREFGCPGERSDDDDDDT